MKAIPYGRQEITQADKQAVLDTLDSDFLTQGPRILEFEKAFAEYIGAPYAVALANGTGALHLAAIALGVKEGSRVISTPVTFAASANGIKYCGGEVTFSDIDKDNFLLDLNKLEDLLKSKPAGYFSGVVPVDLAGYPVDLENLRFLSRKYGIWILEDACHAPGGSFSDSKKIRHNCGDGSLSDAAIFSFHPVKHIATGEGGMITTARKDIYDHLLTLRTHGITRDPAAMSENHGGWYYEMVELGYNYRLSDMQAALGLSQLSRAGKNLDRRQQIADKYNKELNGLPIVLPAVKEGFRHAWHLYIIQTEKRKELYDFLRTKNIFCQVHYIPVHTMPYYRSLGHKKGDCPVAEAYYDRCLSIPMFPSLTDQEQDYVIDCIRQFFK
jgi:UDP-4-amino-4,6-dideoxy-N-acetyl-beta-L-altrosamine transaminase